MIHATLVHKECSMQTKKANMQIASLLVQMMESVDGGSGIRTHDDADTRRMLSEHGYGRSVRKCSSFQGSKEELAYSVQRS